MTKNEFLEQLRRGLSGLPMEDIDERLNFYSEMIDDRIEEGLSEAEAVGAVGSVSDIVSQILRETPLTKLVKEKVKPAKPLKWWAIVLIVLGSPIWLSLLIAAAVIVLAVYVVLWSLDVSLWAVDASLALGAVGGVLSLPIFAAQGHTSTGIAMLGGGLFCAGLAIFLFFGCMAATRGTVWLTKKIALGIKAMFVGKGTEK